MERRYYKFDTYYNAFICDTLDTNWRLHRVLRRFIHIGSENDRGKCYVYNAMKLYTFA